MPRVSALELRDERVRGAESKLVTQSRELEAARNAFDAERATQKTRAGDLERQRVDLDRQRDQLERDRAQLAAARELLRVEQVAQTAAQRQAVSAPKEQVESHARKTELEKFQGTWTLLSVEADGWEVPRALIKHQKFVWVIEGDKITHRPENGSKRQSTFELDLTKTPNEIVFRPLNGHVARPEQAGDSVTGQRPVQAVREQG